jgi:hypothetical protein
MPCLQDSCRLRQFEGKPLSTEKRNQKSTTDSEEKDRIGADSGQTTAQPQAQPSQANAQRAKRLVRQPKIKPNYGTKAGGMMMRKLNMQKVDGSAAPWTQRSVPYTP